MTHQIKTGQKSQQVRAVPDIYTEAANQNRPVVSIELFPPKTPKGKETLLNQTLPGLSASDPDFFSVTYGAGGSTREQTLDVADLIQKQYGITAVAHLTCISSTREEIQHYLQEATSLGIDNILALKGDPPREQPNFVKPNNGFEYSYQLIDFIKSQGDFSIGVTGFPECHIACTEGRQVDWQRVKNKIDHGAKFVLTQLFFDNTDYFEFQKG